MYHSGVESADTMVTKKRIGRYVWMILIAALIIEYLFDPLSSMRNATENIEARLGLPIARARWETHKIKHYMFELHAYQQVCWVIYARIEVSQGRVIQVNYIDFETGEMSEKGIPPSRWDQNPDWIDSFLCNYANFTMPQLFDLAEQGAEHIYKISFDARYGFISEVQFGAPKPNGGLFGPRIGGYGTGFRIENFRVLGE